jgi:hypothetical protein
MHIVLLRRECLSSGKLVKNLTICTGMQFYSGDFVKAHNLQEGDLLILYRNALQGNYV